MKTEEEDLVLLQVHVSWQAQLLLEVTYSLVAVVLVSGHSEAVVVVMRDWLRSRRSPVQHEVRVAQNDQPLCVLLNR